MVGKTLTGDVYLLFGKLKTRLDFQESLWKRMIQVLSTIVFICLKRYLC